MVEKHWFGPFFLLMVGLSTHMNWSCYPLPSPPLAISHLFFLPILLDFSYFSHISEDHSTMTCPLLAEITAAKEYNRLMSLYTGRKAMLMQIFYHSLSHTISQASPACFYKARKIISNKTHFTILQNLLFRSSNIRLRLWSSA